MGGVISQEGVLSLPENLDIAHAAELKNSLQQLLAREGDVGLDGSHVIRSDAAGLQLLLAFTRRCQADGRRCAWRGASEVLRMDAAGLGLARELEFNPQTQGGR